MASSAKLYTSLTTTEVSSTTSNRRPRHLIPWTWEIVGAILSIACIGAIVGILVSIDSQPYRPLNLFSTDITPNTLISIFAALSKAALVPALAAGLGQLKWLDFQAPQSLINMQRYDDAGRGAVGAISFLFTWRSWNLLAPFGAILVILSIATEPFMQQILTYSTVTVSSTNATAVVSTARVLYIPDGNDGLNTTEQNVLATQMSAAIAQGISGTAPDADYTCPSGNCEWPSFETLGVCSSCNDISNLTLVACQNDTSSCQSASCSEDGCIESVCLTQTCTYTAPNNKSATFTWSLSPQMGFQSNPNFDMHISADPFLGAAETNFSTKRDIPSPSAATNISDGVFANFTTFRTAQAYGIPAPYDTMLDADGNVTVAMFGALTSHAVFPNVSFCTINLCLQTLQPSVSNGNYTDHALTSTPVLLTCDLFDNSGEVNPLTPHCPVYPATSPLPSPLPSPPNNTISWPSSYSSAYSNTTRFYIDEWYLSTLQNALADALDTSTRPVLATLLQWQHNGNMTSIFADVSGALTALLRRGDTTTGGMTGVLARPVVFVRVRWAWLVYPVGIVGGGIGFLVAVMVVAATGRGAGVPVWKDSALAVVFHGGGVGGDGGREGLEGTEMERVARRMRRRLGRDGRGVLGLVEVEGEGDGKERRRSGRMGDGEVEDGRVSPL